VTASPLLHALRVYGPLLALGALAGALQASTRRAATARGRRALQATWMGIVLVGAPAWLLVAAALGWL
jgi:hypothetical protein